MKRAKGNMYGWVTHTHSVLTGECPHRCSYCYVRQMGKRFPNLRRRYTGSLALDEAALKEPLGRDRTIFVEHMNDLWADAVPNEWISRVLSTLVPGNRYVFQTKNPTRYLTFFDQLPRYSILGTTVESDKVHAEMGSAPTPLLRLAAMVLVGQRKPVYWQTFVTVEPIMKFTGKMAEWIVMLRPDFINIGADSKCGGLSEPSPSDVKYLVEALRKEHIEVRLKPNLKRIVEP